MKTKATIIGDGGWGTALGLLLLENGCDVTIWGPFPETIRAIAEHRENRWFLPGVPLPPELRWTSDRQEAIEGAEVVVLAIPTKFYRDVMASFAGLLPPDAHVVSVAKGLDQTRHTRMTQVAEELLGHAPVAALSGPSHAEEVARRIPTAVCIACADDARSRALQAIFSNQRFRAYRSDDVAGVELGGALKNIIAVAAGVSDGIGFGDNSRAALITRGLVELTRLGCALGGRPATFQGLSGVGDLIVTCNSKHSRNRAVGERLGRGETIEQIQQDMKQVAEGVWNATVARDIARERGIEVPIIEEVYAVIYEKKNPLAAVGSLMARDLKAEA